MWANQKPEDGLDGGAQPKHIVEKTASKLRGKKHSEAQYKAQSERQRGKKKSEEWINKRIGSTYKKHKEWEIFGENHWKSDKTLYELENISTGERVVALKSTFRKMIKNIHIHRLIIGERKTSNGWKFVRMIE